MIDYNLLALQNPWWQNRELIKVDDKLREFNRAGIKYYPRNILNLKLKPGAVNILSGPRQTGKSTALKLLIKNLLEQPLPPENIFYFNCDALSTRQEIIDLVLSFLNGLKNPQDKLPPNYLFLDEISSVTDWPYAIKWLADGGLLAKSKMILTGSSSINLKKSGEFLPGRRHQGQDFRYLPVSFKDYAALIFPEIFADLTLDSYQKIARFRDKLIRKKINLPRLYRDFLLTGGFLKMINAFRDQEPFAETGEIFRSGLKSELAKAGKKELFARKVLEKIIGSLTAETSYTNVAEEAELGSKNTAADYLNFFSDSFMLTETLFYNISQKRVVLKKNKKYYPVDPFFLWIFHSFISGSTNLSGFYRQYSVPPLDSKLAETFVAGELFKQNQEFYFFRNSRELDFYLPKLKLGIEVKYKNKIVSADLKGLKPAKSKIIVSRQTLAEKDGVLVIPAYLFGLVNLTQISR